MTPTTGPRRAAVEAVGARCWRENKGGGRHESRAMRPTRLAALVAADVPLVLLPVRLETRFDRRDGRRRSAGPRLSRRGSCRHARARADGRGVDVRDDGSSRRSARRRQTKTRRARRGVGLPIASAPHRAAWIAQAAARPASRRGPRAWTRAAVDNVLPDRWIALGYRDGVRRVRSARKAIDPDRLTLGPGSAASWRRPIPRRRSASGARWLVDFDRAVPTAWPCAFRSPDADAAGFDRLVVLGVRRRAMPPRARRA